MRSSSGSKGGGGSSPSPPLAGACGSTLFLGHGLPPSKRIPAAMRRTAAARHTTASFSRKALRSRRVDGLSGRVEDQGREITSHIYELAAKLDEHLRRHAS